LIGTVLSPAFTVGAILATLYGATVHMILGGDGRRLAATIVAAWVGFWIGLAIAQIMELHVMSLGVAQCSQRITWGTSSGSDDRISFSSQACEVTRYINSDVSLTLCTSHTCADCAIMISMSSDGAFITGHRFDL
jgi:hypothetical protein